MVDCSVSVRSGLNQRGQLLGNDVGSSRGSYLIALLGWVVLLASGSIGLGQGTLFSPVLSTGAGTPLISTVLPLNVDPASSAATLEFDFAYASDEPIEASSSKDGIACSILDRPALHGSVLFMLDRSALTLAPRSVGLYTMNRSDVQLTPISWPGLEGPQDWRTAFHVSVTLPAELQTRSLELDFHLFDNLDDLTSRLWVTSPVVVPEPRLLLGLILGLASIGLRRRSSR